jgi:hypothetical protein
MEEKENGFFRAIEYRTRKRPFKAMLLFCVRTSIETKTDRAYSLDRRIGDSYDRFRLGERRKF